MGLVINRATNLQLDDIFTTMEIEYKNPTITDQIVLTGGPMQEETGFVLHQRTLCDWESSFNISDDLSVTTSKDILKAIAKDEGPSKALLILGCCGWDPGQLENELLNNFWLTTKVKLDILFDIPLQDRWDSSIRSLGFEPSQLVTAVGHA